MKRPRHNRPRSRAPVSLPPVEEAFDRRADEMPLLVDTSASDVSWKDPTAWRFEYRATYTSGQFGYHRRAICGARKKETAIWALRELLAGMGVIRIRLYHIEPPPSAEKVAAIEQANRELDREWERTMRT